jgi:hypothetical protein
MNVIVVTGNEIVSSDGRTAFDSIQEAIVANCPLYVHAPFYVELLKNKSDLLSKLKNRGASLVFPLTQDSSFIAFIKLLKERNWTENGVLRMKRSKNTSSKTKTGDLVSDLYMITQTISPISRISGVSIAHEPSKTTHSIFTIRFSNKSMGHYEHLSSPHVSNELDLEWSGREGILEYESQHAKAFRGSNIPHIEKDFRLEGAVEITSSLNEELRKLMTCLELDIKHEVRG